ARNDANHHWLNVAKSPLASALAHSFDPKIHVLLMPNTDNALLNISVPIYLYRRNVFALRYHRINSLGLNQKPYLFVMVVLEFSQLTHVKAALDAHLDP